MTAKILAIRVPRGGPDGYMEPETVTDQNLIQKLVEEYVAVRPHFRLHLQASPAPAAAAGD